MGVKGLFQSNLAKQITIKQILKIGLLEPEIHPIEIHRLLTFVLNYINVQIFSEHII